MYAQGMECGILYALQVNKPKTLKEFQHKLMIWSSQFPTTEDNSMMMDQ